MLFAEPLERRDLAGELCISHMSLHIIVYILTGWREQCQVLGRPGGSSVAERSARQWETCGHLPQLLFPGAVQRKGGLRQTITPAECAEMNVYVFFFGCAVFN